MRKAVKRVATNTEEEAHVRGFRDRPEAGRLLAQRLSSYANRPDVLILALARGGVPVGFEIAKALRVPLDVIVVRKLGLPGQEELAMGAITTGGIQVLNDVVVDSLGIPQRVIESVASKERVELERRERLYRSGWPAQDVRGRTVIVVDDGLATGTTMRVAVAALRKQSASRIIVAIPIGAVSTCQEMNREADEVVCLVTPEDLTAVGMWYEDFSQVSDPEVCDLLKQATGIWSTGPPVRK